MPKQNLLSGVSSFPIPEVDTKQNGRLHSQQRKSPTFEGLVGHDIDAKEANDYVREENPWREEADNPQAVDTRLHMLKEDRPILTPRYNTIYDTMRSNQAWRYTSDNFATGSLSVNPGATTITPVTLAQKINTRISQWPGAIQMFLYLRSFSIVPQNTTNVPTETSVPATAGNVTIVSGAGTLLTVMCTTVGTAALNFQDGAGNIIGIVPASATVGQVFTFNMPFNTSLVAQKTANTPVVTVGYVATFIPGGIDCYYNDIIAGAILPLGDFSTLVGGNVSPDILLTSPITDPGIQAVGQLQFITSTGPNVSAATYYWQLGFSYAYLITQEHGYDIVQQQPYIERGGTVFREILAG